MIEYFEVSRHVPDNVVGRIVVQFDLTNGVPRKIPNIGNAYKVTEAKGKQLKGNPLGSAPKKAFLNINTIALVCDTEKELSLLCSAHNKMRLAKERAETEAHKAIMSLSGLPTESGPVTDKKQKETKDGGTRTRQRTRRRARSTKS